MPDVRSTFRDIMASHESAPAPVVPDAAPQPAAPEPAPVASEAAPAAPETNEAAPPTDPASPPVVDGAQDSAATKAPLVSMVRHNEVVRQNKDYKAQLEAQQQQLAQLTAQMQAFMSQRQAPIPQPAVPAEPAAPAMPQWLKDLQDEADEGSPIRKLADEYIKQQQAIESLSKKLEAPQSWMRQQQIAAAQQKWSNVVNTLAEECKGLPPQVIEQMLEDGVKPSRIVAHYHELRQAFPQQPAPVAPAAPTRPAPQSPPQVTSPAAAPTPGPVSLDRKGYWAWLRTQFNG